jgi:hypothetical protein
MFEFQRDLVDTMPYLPGREWSERDPWDMVPPIVHLWQPSFLGHTTPALVAKIQTKASVVLAQESFFLFFKKV